MIAVAVVIALTIGFLCGFVTGRLPVATPTFYQPTVELPHAIVLERVRDQRADISAALRRS